jgi:hypothetical protein
MAGNLHGSENTRLAIFVSLLTLGAVLMLTGVGWLTFLGLALVSLTEFFVSEKSYKGRLSSYLFCVGATILILIAELCEGEAFVPKARPLWFWILVVGLWAWGIVTQFRKWQKRRELPKPEGSRA